MADQERMVLARFLAVAGVASRRAAHHFIREGRVKVNGTVTTDLTVRVGARDQVECDGRPLKASDKVYLLLNKPKGYVCSAKDRHAEKLALDLVDLAGVRLFSVGRLDKESEGLLLMTNDGDFTLLLTHPRYHVPKVYEIEVTGTVSQADLARLLAGVEHEGDILKASAAEIIARDDVATQLRITVCEGKKREVRRMCKVLDLHVIRLVRTSIGPLMDNILTPGTWRHLTAEEVRALQALRLAATEAAIPKTT